MSVAHINPIPVRVRRLRHEVQYEEEAAVAPQRRARHRRSVRVPEVRQALRQRLPTQVARQASQSP